MQCFRFNLLCSSALIQSCHVSCQNYVVRFANPIIIVIMMQQVYDFKQEMTLDTTAAALPTPVGYRLAVSLSIIFL